jgi:hypothetical protein
MLSWPPDQTITDRICGKGQLFLGQENFIEEIKHLLKGKEKLKEITRAALKEIFKPQNKKSKNQVM